MISLDKIKTIVDMAQAGESVYRIAAAADCCISTVYQTLRANGLHTPKRKADTQRRAAIAKLMAGGKTPVDAALEVGVTPQTAYSVAEEYNIATERGKISFSTYDVIARILHGDSWSDISRAVGCSKQRIGQIATSLRKAGLDPDTFILAKFLKEAGFVHNNHRGPHMCQPRDEPTAEKGDEPCE